MASVTCITPSLFGHALTAGQSYAVVAFNRDRRRVRVRGDHGRLVWMPTTCFAATDIVALLPRYTIWIEADHLEPFDPHDDNAGVLVTFEDGASWGATLFTYTNIASLVEKNRQTGEGISGKYFWARHMILVDTISRESVEAVVMDLLAIGEFEQVLERYPDETEDTVATAPEQP